MKLTFGDGSTYEFLAGAGVGRLEVRTPHGGGLISTGTIDVYRQIRDALTKMIVLAEVAAEMEKKS